MTGIIDEIIEIHTLIAKDYLPRLKDAIAEVEQGSYDALAVAKDVVRVIEGTVNGTVTNAAPAQAVQVQAPVLSASVQELAAQQPEQGAVAVDDTEDSALAGAGDAAAAVRAEAAQAKAARSTRTTK
jgi:hypothetical protein